MMLPSKKVLSILILTVAVATSVVIAFGRDKGSSAINLAQNLVAGEKVSIPENPSWQSELGKVAENIAPVEVTPQTDQKQTVTDTVSTSLVSNYLALKQSGTLTQESAQKLVDGAVNYVGGINPKTILATELNIIADNGTQSITDYGENLGAILKTSKPTVIKNELEIIIKAAQSKDQAKIYELDEIILSYENLTQKLKKMLVPKTFVKAHLDMVNGTMSMATSLVEMKIVLGDPIKGLTAIQTYQIGTKMFTQAFRATNTFINQTGIIYKQGSGGYYLLYGI